MSIYDDLIAAGCKVESRYSDLYTPDTPEARAIIAKNGKKVDGWSVLTFRSQIDGKPWLEVVFGFTPFWEKACVTK